jgi:hypothetical protein
VDIGTFWDIIETARASAGQDSPFHESLTDHLATLGEQDIVEYRECFEKTLGVLYRYDLWAVAYLIGAGCPDDGFIDFRAGLIAQGRDWYQKAAASPGQPRRPCRRGQSRTPPPRQPVVLRGRVPCVSAGER